MPEPIRGRVARILNTREVVLNRGSQEGVQFGMRFAVLDPLGEDVIDPETGRVLGSVKRVKVHVKAVSVSEHLSVAITDDYTEINVGGLDITGAAGLARMFEPRRTERHFRTLLTEEAAWQPLDESESYVKVGDPVEQIIGDGSEGVAADAPGSVANDVDADGATSH